MTVIVNMACGLANRMFQYSYYLYLQQAGYDVAVDYYQTAKLKHEHVRWNEIFPHAPIRQASAWDVLRTGGGDYPVDGVFLLRDAMAPTQLVPGLEGAGGHVAVNAKMQTNLPGCFACGDAVGLPYQYVKAAGEGNVAALSAVEYLAARKRNEKE